jgi:hypothetical protein
VKGIFFPREDNKEGVRDAAAVAKKPPAQCAN